MMRKILYSPDFGAGWVSWHSGGTKEQKLFMLEYQPFIEYLEKRHVAKRASWQQRLTVYYAPRTIPDTLREQFKKDWAVKFPGVDEPYLGGLSNLAIYEVPGGAQVRISEHDGHESVEVQGDFDDWL